MENTVEFYYEKLKNSPTPGNVLAALYCSLYDKGVSRSEIILCNKLVKVFGRFTLFFSIIDMAGSYEKEPENPYSLLYTICKRKFESSHVGATVQSRLPLDSYISTIDKQIERIEKKKFKTPSSKGLEPDGN